MAPRAYDTRASRRPAAPTNNKNSAIAKKTAAGKKGKAKKCTVANIHPEDRSSPESSDFDYEEASGVPFPELAKSYCSPQDQSLARERMGNASYAYNWKLERPSKRRRLLSSAGGIKRVLESSRSMSPAKPLGPNGAATATIAGPSHHIVSDQVPKPPASPTDSIPSNQSGEHGDADKNIRENDDDDVDNGKGKAKKPMKEDTNIKAKEDKDTEKEEAEGADTNTRQDGGNTLGSNGSIGIVPTTKLRRGQACNRCKSKKLRCNIGATCNQCANAGSTCFRAN